MTAAVDVKYQGGEGLVESALPWTEALSVLQNDASRPTKRSSSGAGQDCGPRWVRGGALESGPGLTWASRAEADPGKGGRRKEGREGGRAEPRTPRRDSICGLDPDPGIGGRSWPSAQARRVPHAQHSPQAFCCRPVIGPSGLFLANRRTAAGASSEARRAGAPSSCSHSTKRGRPFRVSRSRYPVVPGIQLFG